jgi:hypothetical protein
VLGAYTFWDVMWTMIVFFAWIMFITWVIMLMIDNFRRKDHGGGAKALWFIFLIFFPIVGALTYTIMRPKDAEGYAYEPGGSYAPSAPTSTAAELTRLNELRTEGAISDAEYEDLKARTIGAS